MKIDFRDIRILNDLAIMKVIEPEFIKVNRKTVDRDNPRNKGKNPATDEMITKDVTEWIAKDIQVAEVLNINEDNKFGVKKGDKVVVNMSRLKKFDMWSPKEVKATKANVKSGIYGISVYEIFGVV